MILRTIFLAAILVAGPAQAATPIPSGKWSFVFNDAKAPDRPMRVYTYRPASCDARCPLVMLIHDLERDGSRYRDAWVEHAERHRFALAAPEFADRWWARDAYASIDPEKDKNRERWSFAALERVFDEVAEGRDGYLLYGHGVGGEFAVRMSLLRPDHRAKLIVAANPGWYTFPEWRKEKKPDRFPYTLFESPVGETELRAALQRRVVVLVGENDTDGQHKTLKRTEPAMKQGANRLQRAENFFKAATATANELGVKLGWQLTDVPGVGHDGFALSPTAADILRKP